MSRRGPLPALLAALLLASPPALAHKLKVFATAEGATIAGYAYFTGGTRAQDAALKATLPDGAPVFTGTTDADGAFRFQARLRADHHIAVDSGDGHQAGFILPASELPETLPSPAGAPPLASPPPADTPPSAVVPGLPTEALAADALVSLIERAVARQIRPLREDLDATRERASWHDTLGGIGIIFGVAGLAYGLAMRRRGGRGP